MTSTRNTTKKFNEEELLDNFHHNHLDHKLKVLRDQYINSLSVEKPNDILDSNNNISKPVSKSNNNILKPVSKSKTRRRCSIL